MVLELLSKIINFESLLDDWAQEGDFLGQRHIPSHTFCAKSQPMHMPKNVIPLQDRMLLSISLDHTTAPFAGLRVSNLSGLIQSNWMLQQSSENIPNRNIDDGRRNQRESISVGVGQKPKSSVKLLDWRVRLLRYQFEVAIFGRQHSRLLPCSISQEKFSIQRRRKPSLCFEDNQVLIE